jgi:hypothetical protein
MTIELSDRELELIIQSMRSMERSSRNGFARRLVDRRTDVDDSELLEKIKRARLVHEEMASLRVKLGDNSNIKVG